MSESTTSDAVAPAAQEVPPSRVRTVWKGDRRFETGRDGVPMAILDGDAQAGQSPMDALLSSLAACSGIDVVDILAKRRTPAESLEIRVEGRRRATLPRRFIALRLEYHVTGQGIDPGQAQRAIDLAFEKYCSAAASLAPDMAVETVLVLNGSASAPVAQRIPG